MIRFRIRNWDRGKGKKSRIGLDIGKGLRVRDPV